MGIEPDSNTPSQPITDEEALAAIDKLEAENNPSIEPQPQQHASSPLPVTTFTTTPVTTKEVIGTPEKPIISGPKKSSKSMIVILIALIFLIIGGTVAYLKFTHSI